jgi:hypothetical protein
MILADSGLASRLQRHRQTQQGVGGAPELSARYELFNEMRGPIRAAGRLYSDWQQWVVDIDNLTPIPAEFRS